MKPDKAESMREIARKQLAKWEIGRPVYLSSFLHDLNSYVLRHIIECVAATLLRVLPETPTDADFIRFEEEIAVLFKVNRLDVPDELLKFEFYDSFNPVGDEQKSELVRMENLMIQASMEYECPEN